MKLMMPLTAPFATDSMTGHTSLPVLSHEHDASDKRGGGDDDQPNWDW